jgi:phage recombination protein Bet
MTLEALRDEIAATRHLLAGDVWAKSASNPNKHYRMILTPDGFATHLGEGCEAEPFHGVLGCRHSKEHSVTEVAIRAEAVLTPAPIEFNDSQLAVIKNTIAKGATDAELELFVSTCKRTGLDPFMRQIYFIKRYDAATKGQVGAIQVGIDGQRLIAERTGLYDGQDPIEWLDTDGVWSEVWTGTGDNPVAARCSVYRKDWSAGRKATAVVRWDSYAQTYVKDGKRFYSPTWKAMPDVMLGKCAESLALRRAFPAEMSAVAALAGQAYDPSLEDEKAIQEHIEPEGVLEGEFNEVPQQEPEGEIGGRTSEPAAGPGVPPADTSPDIDCPKGGEHLPKYSEDLTVLVCEKCDAVLEGPPETE